MNPISRKDFKHIWCVDFEFSAPDGERPIPICLVAKEVRGGQVLRLRAEELAQVSRPPYPIGQDDLLVAYYASAEMGCHLALGWSLPAYVLDLYAEFRNFTNGKPRPCGDSLLGALAYFGLDAMGAMEKEDMR